MNENTPSSVQWNDNPNGTVTFATDVVAKMAGLAATEVEGVASMSATSSGFADIFSRRTQSSRNFTKGVKIAIENNRVLVDVSIIVEYGTPVPDVASNIQENVKKAIETMSGLDVQSVDVHVQGMSFEKENRAVQELEAQQQRLLEEQRAAEAAEEDAAKEAAQKEAAAKKAAESAKEEEPMDVLEDFPEAPEVEDEEEIAVEVEADEPEKDDEE